MKKIFNSLLLIILFPLVKLKRVFKDNFLSGLIVGAVFSLLVNLISMQIQGLIDKQRVLEAIENEVITNNMKAENDASKALTQRNNKNKANNYIIARKFSRDLWEQSIEPLQYAAQLDSEQQYKINLYYTLAVPEANQLIETLNKQHVESMKDCFDFHKVLTIQEQNLCNNEYYFYLDNIALYPGKMIHDSGDELLKVFHPTRNRLNSLILRFLMGSESMRILSGE